MTIQNMRTWPATVKLQKLEDTLVDQMLTGSCIQTLKILCLADDDSDDADDGDDDGDDDDDNDHDDDNDDDDDDDDGGMSGRRGQGCE